MRRGQGSLEALLMMGAVLLIAALVVFAANSFLNSPARQGNTATEKADCILNDAELIGYDTPYTGDKDGSEPTSIKWKTKTLTKQTSLYTASETEFDLWGDPVCHINTFPLHFYRQGTAVKYYLGTKGASSFIEYKEANEQTENTLQYITISADSTANTPNCMGDSSSKVTSRVWYLQGPTGVQDIKETFTIDFDKLNAPKVGESVMLHIKIASEPSSPNLWVCKGTSCSTKATYTGSVDAWSTGIDISSLAPTPWGGTKTFTLKGGSLDNTYYLICDGNTDYKPFVKIE